MSTINIHLLQFENSLAKMRTLNLGIPELIQKKKSSYISYITFAILPFSYESTLTKLPS